MYDQTYSIYRVVPVLFSSVVRNVPECVQCVSLPACSGVYIWTAATWLLLRPRPFSGKGEQMKSTKGKGRERGKDKEKEI